MLLLATRALVSGPIDRRRELAGSAACYILVSIVLATAALAELEAAGVAIYADNGRWTAPRRMAGPCCRCRRCSRSSSAA
jgi:hypothetical protein